LLQIAKIVKYCAWCVSMIQVKPSYIHYNSYVSDY